MAAPAVCLPCPSLVASWLDSPPAAPTPTSPQFFGAQAVSPSRLDVQFDFNMRAHMYELVAQVPEQVVHVDQIFYSTEDRFLTVGAHREDALDSSKTRTARARHASALFTHSVKFPKDVNPDVITITLKKGILRVQLPRRRDSPHYRMSDL